VKSAPHGLLVADWVLGRGLLKGRESSRSFSCNYPSNSLKITTREGSRRFPAFQQTTPKPSQLQETVWRGLHRLPPNITSSKVLSTNANIIISIFSFYIKALFINIPVIKKSFMSKGTGLANHLNPKNHCREMIHLTCLVHSSTHRWPRFFSTTKISNYTQ
jgi:hypothetical protein